MKHLKIATSMLVLVSFASCTKLDEKLQGDVTFAEAQTAIDINSLLKAAYDSYRGPFQDQTGVFSMQDMSTDQCLGPTRGGDWDDNGVWRVLHQHTWNADNQRIRDNFNNLSQIVFNTTNVLVFKPSNAIKAEALMLRAYAMFYLLDLYNQVPFRDPGENLLKPSRVLNANEALTQIITDLNAAMPDLTDGPANKANKWAAKALLMKCYINKGVYANRANPTFATADLDQVITIGSEIVASNKFALENVYWNAFSPQNTENSTEVIFANKNTREEAGNVRWTWHASTHYNQKPSGWNGFATLATFYNSFDATDQRRGDSARSANGVAIGNVTDRTGLRVGLLRGQQFGEGGVPLKDRAGNNLVFGDNIDNIVTGSVELPGIRVVKYIPDMKDDFSDDRGNADNDYVLLRYADVLLMWAEAQLRKGNGATALTTVNTIRAKRGASALASITLASLLAERGREMYWESWRRNDLVRFGEFLKPYGTTKPNTSDAKYLIFPVPTNALAVNPNLKQNPGY
jgi:starch-binding outer membrane protein, SusD/RagB family